MSEAVLPKGIERERRKAIRMLLLLTRSTMPDDAAERATELVAAGMDWDYLLGQASRHRVLPLVARNLQHLDLFVADPYLYANMDTYLAAYRYHQARNAALEAELREILPYVQERVPRLVIRKGLLMARRYYRDLGVRPMMDIDILVTRTDAPAVVEVLETLGYATGKVVQRGRRVEPLPRDESLFWRLHVDALPPLFRLTSEPTVRIFNIDVSTGLFLPKSGYSVPTEQVLDRAADLELGEVRVRAPSPEDLLLDLCAHLYKESTTLRYIHRLKHQRLIQYCDLREVIVGSRAELRWRTFLDLAKEYKVQQVMYYSLAHLEMLFPQTVPEEVLGEVGNGVSAEFLDEYAAVDGGTPLRWPIGLFERMFATTTKIDAPNSLSPV